MLLHEDDEEEDEDEESVKIYLYFIPHVTFSSNFLLLFYMLSTLMSLEDRLRLKLKVKTYVWL